MTVLSVKHFKSNFDKGDHSFNVSRTLAISQVGNNTFFGGLRLYIPFSKRQTKGCLPMTIPSIGASVAERLDW